MKTKNLRRPYAAPNAELICLAPSAPIASNGNWTWGSDNNKWDKNHMGISILGSDASAIGFGKWTGTEELDTE